MPEGISLCGWMSLGHSQGRQEGEFVAGASLTILVHLLTWMGSSHPICGDVEAAGKPEVSKLQHREWSKTKGSAAAAAAAAAKSLQSCPTLCDPIDGSPPGSPVPGIFQARRLEWVAISFSNAWKWKVKVKLPSRVRLFATPWTAAYPAPPSMGFSRQEHWSGLALPSPCLTWAKVKTRMWLGGHSVFQRCSQLLLEHVMNFPGHNPHHNGWNWGKYYQISQQSP